MSDTPHPEHPIAEPPDENDPHPEHPIAPGGPPPGTWGGAGQPFPTPPIVVPSPPLIIWGGGGVPMPNPPIYLPPNTPGVPTHPIYYPPGIWGPTDPRPGWGLPEQPPGIWGGGNVPMPNPPIHIPPGIWGGGNVPMPTPPIYLPEPSPEPPEPELPVSGEDGYWVASPGNAPLVYVRAAGTEQAAEKYGKAFGLHVGTPILVATEHEDFTVGVESAEVTHHD